MQRHILSCRGGQHSSYWCRYHVMGRQGELIIANLAHSKVALLWFQHGGFLDQTAVFHGWTRI